MRTSCKTRREEKKKESKNRIKKFGKFHRFTNAIL